MIDKHQHRQLSSPFQTLHYRSPVQFQTASPVTAPVQIKSKDDHSEQFSLSKLQDRTSSTSEFENSNQLQERQSSKQLLQLKPKLVEQLSKLNPDQIERLRILLKDLKSETKLNKGQFGTRKGHQKEGLRIVPAGKKRTSQNWSGRDFERSGTKIMKNDTFEKSKAAILESDIFEKSGTAIMESDIFDRSSRSVNLIYDTLTLENSPKLPRDEIQLKDTEKAIRVRNKFDTRKKGIGVEKEKTENSAPGLPLLPVSSAAGKKKHYMSKNRDLQFSFEVGLLLFFLIVKIQS